MILSFIQATLMMPPTSFHCFGFGICGLLHIKLLVPYIGSDIHKAATFFLSKVIRLTSREQLNGTYIQYLEGKSHMNPTKEQYPNALTKTSHVI